jgi:hypothetical protein
MAGRGRTAGKLPLVQMIANVGNLVVQRVEPRAKP